MKDKFTWIIAPDLDWDDKKEMITTSLESGIDTVLDLIDIENINKIGNMNVVCNSPDADIYLIGLNGEGDGFLPLDLAKSKDLESVKEAKSEGKTVCSFVEITDKDHEQLAVKLGKVSDYIILVSTDWTVIPLENIIADLQSEDVKIIAAVNSIEEARLAIETLEVGCDGVIFEANSFALIKEIADLVNSFSTEDYELVDATVTDIKPLSTGDRVCIDTTTIMEPGEGMLIGSYSKNLFLIHSESLESEYVASRPFRVNAGPVQAYVMVSGNKTRYLSELETGDEVLIVNNKGITRPAIVGRCKIEKRPLMLIEAEYEGTTFKTLVQNAETIRLVDENNETLSVANMKVGDKVKVYIEESARHFGMSIDETIIEK